MNKTQKWLIAAVMILVVVNVVLLGIVWRGHTRLHGGNAGVHDRGGRPEITGRSIIRDLDLNSEQRTQFRSVLVAHRKRMDSLNGLLRQAKHEVNKAIISEDSVSLTEMNQQLFLIQQKVELETQNLTRQLSYLSNTEQRQKFLKSMEEVLTRDRRRIQRRE